MNIGALNFSVKHVETECGAKDLEESYALRYQTYCIEEHFIAKKNDTILEYDKYDDFSEHIVVIGGESNRVIATGRLVRYSEMLRFPTGDFFPELYESLPHHPYAEISEISRLCISKEFRRRQSDGLYGIDGYIGKTDDRRKYPIILLLIFKGLYNVSKRSGIKYWLATMEDSLFRVLSKYSVHFRQLKDEYIDYYGKVKPYFAEISELEEIMKLENAELLNYFDS
jgi:N-acyl amino acid synthase of PEP-CTERM/exosortase system